MSLQLPDTHTADTAGTPSTLPPRLLALLTADPPTPPDSPTLGTGAMLVCPHCNQVLHLQLTACTPIFDDGTAPAAHTPDAEMQP